MKVKGVLYKITNKVSGKIYIGISLVSAKSRFKSHMKRAKYDKSSPMYDDYHKFGEKSFTIRVLKEANAIKLKKLEIYYINTKYKCRIPNGYNIAKGGVLPDSDLFGDSAFTYKGILYKNYRHLCKCLNLSYKKFMSYINQHYTVRQAVNRTIKWNSLSVYERRVITNKNRTKHFIILPKVGKISLKEGCKKYGICYDSVISSMLKDGLSADEAFNKHYGLVYSQSATHYQGFIRECA